MDCLQQRLTTIRLARPVWSQLQYYPERPLLILETERFSIPWEMRLHLGADNLDVYCQVNLLLNIETFILPLRLLDEQREWKDPNEKSNGNERYLTL